MSSFLYDRKTYRLKVSLYFGDQFAFLYFVLMVRFLSAKWGPIRFTSTRGLKVWTLGHLRSFAATTGKEKRK